MQNRSIVVSVVEEVAREQNKSMPPLSDDLRLVDSGLDSLCFAVIVARLEDRLGIDPLSTANEAQFPVTLGDFITLYN